MNVQDDGVFRIVEKLGAHFRTNINNRIVRPVLLKMDLDNVAWDRVERLANAGDAQRSQGFDLEELYEQIFATAQFIARAKKQVAPTIRTLLSGGGAQSHGGRENQTDKILRDMAINNFGANLGVLTDTLNELYVKTVECDKRANGEKNAIYARMPELKQIGQLLV